MFLWVHVEAGMESEYVRCQIGITFHPWVEKDSMVWFHLKRDKWSDPFGYSREQGRVNTMWARGNVAENSPLPREVASVWL